MISVIMSTYREPLKYVRESAASILNQTYQDIEFIIIVDDPNHEELIVYLKDLENADNRVKVVVNEVNCGLPESLNKAIKLSSGEYIARMDADDISEADRLEAELKFLQENNLDLVGCNIRNIDEDGHIINIRGTNYPVSDAAIKKYLKTNSAIPHPTWLVRRKVYIDSGMYQNFPAAQDYDFLTRIAIDNKKLGNLREPKFRYRINDSGISSKKKVLQKTIQHYIKQNYKKGKKSSLDNFYKFLNSKEGEKKKYGLKKYYEQSAKLKTLWKKRRYIEFLMLGTITFFFSDEGRGVVLNVIKEKFLEN